MEHQFTFYIQPEQITGKQAGFSVEESHHIHDVLRIALGSVITAVDGAGRRYRIRLDEWHERRCWGTIGNVEITEKNPLLPLHLALPCLKGDRWQIAIEGACEFGTQSVRLVNFERALTRWTVSKQGKAQRKSVEILKQSGGSLLTDITVPSTLRDLLEGDDFSAVYVADISGGDPSPPPPDALIVIGPEAGFSAVENELLDNVRAIRFRMSVRRLRSEIAVVAALARWQYFFVNRNPK